MKRRALPGFTLIEVLIALAIVAVGLGAAVRATTSVIQGAEDMKLRTLAQWVAEDRLAESVARSDARAAGTSQGTATQAGVPFVWRRTVALAVQPNLYSVAVEVTPADRSNYVVARLTGGFAVTIRSP